MDYTVRLGQVGDPRLPSIAKMKRDARAEVAALKSKEPELGREYERQLFGPDPVWDEPLGVPLEELDNVVKEYPGSAKGPEPEDDPKHYSEWFMRNQPEDLIYGKDVERDYSDLGVKWRWVYAR